MSDVYYKRGRAVPILAPRSRKIYFLQGEEIELGYAGRDKWYVMSVPRCFTCPGKHTNEDEDLSFLYLDSDINTDQLFVGKSIMGNIIVKIVDELHISSEDEIII